MPRIAIGVGVRGVRDVPGPCGTPCGHVSRQSSMTGVPGIQEKIILFGDRISFEAVRTPCQKPYIRS